MTACSVFWEIVPTASGGDRRSPASYLIVPGRLLASTVKLVANFCLARRPIVEDIDVVQIAECSRHWDRIVDEESLIGNSNRYLSLRFSWFVGFDQRERSLARALEW